MNNLCAATGEIVGYQHVACCGTAVTARSVVFAGWAVVVSLCSAHAQLWDQDNGGLPLIDLSKVAQ